MENPLLNYFLFSDLRNHELRLPQNLTKRTKILTAKDLVSFLPESEIFYFQRTMCFHPKYRGELSANIIIIHGSGTIPYDGLCLRPKQLLQRTRDVYAKVFEEGEMPFEIFPVVVPDEHNQIVQEEGKYYTIDDFPTKQQIAPIEILLKAFIYANPNPFQRLAIISSSPGYLEHSEKTFNRIAMKYSNSVQLKLA